MADEVEVIQHLLDVESEANKLMLGAQQESDKRIAEARAQAEGHFKEEYGKIMSALEAHDHDARQRIDREHQDALASYRDGLLGNAKDTGAFNALMKKLLSA